MFKGYYTIETFNEIKNCYEQLDNELYFVDISTAKDFVSRLKQQGRNLKYRIILIEEEDEF